MWHWVWLELLQKTGSAKRNCGDENVGEEEAFQPPSTPETLKRISWAPLPWKDESLRLESYGETVTSHENVHGEKGGPVVSDKIPEDSIPVLDCVGCFTNG